MTTYTDVLTYVSTITERGEIDQLFDALRARSKAMHEVHARATAAALKPGDRVQIDNIRPKRLEGMLGTVTRQKAGRGKPVFYVKIDGDEYESGIPAACLTKVDA